MKRTLSPRKHQYVATMSTFLILLITVVSIASMVGCGGGGGGGGGADEGFYGGKGTVVEPYQVTTWHHLNNLRNDLDSYFVLENNLDSATAGYAELAGPTANGGKGWKPIGSVELLGFDQEFVDAFTGTFDGQGYEIRDLFINRPDEDGVGLFGAVDVGGVVADVGVVDADVTGGTWVGIVIGGCAGTVSNSGSSGSVSGVGDLAVTNVGGLVGGATESTVSSCYAAGTVNGDSNVGGLVGWNYDGTVDNCYSADIVSGSDSVGGLVGYNSGGDISNCYATGEVSGSQAGAGGLVGSSRGNLRYSYATGSVTGVDQVGGLVGDNSEPLSDSDGGGLPGGDVSNCYATGDVTGEGIDVGGLAGSNGGTVSQSYATGSVTSEGSNSCVGGLVGSNYLDATVSDSYSTGNVAGIDWVGGLAGTNEGSVSNSYSVGSVTGRDFVGGLVGQDDGTVSDSFWDIQTSGQTASAGGTGKASSEMKSITTFSDAAWDIVTVASHSTHSPSYVWNIVDSQTYPFLSWEP